MSDKPTKPTNDEEGAGGVSKLSVKRRIAIFAVSAVALLTILVAITVLVSGFTSSTTIESPAEQQVSSEPAPDAQAQMDLDEDASAEQVDVAEANEDEAACGHDWTVTYKTVHHDAVTHTETVEPVYGEETTYHTVCNECSQVIDGSADQHIKETGHSGYSTNVPITDEVVVSEGYTREVTDTPAYDETVVDEMVCTLCGETRSIEGDAN